MNNPSRQIYRKEDGLGRKKGMRGERKEGLYTYDCTQATTYLCLGNSLNLLNRSSRNILKSTEDFYPPVVKEKLFEI